MNGESPRALGKDSTPQDGRVDSVLCARDRRIRKRADYLRIQKTTVRLTSRHFVLLLAACPYQDRARLGITTSRKIGVAVIRNRARRLLREAMRTMPEFIPTGVDLVVVVRVALTQLHTQDVANELRLLETLVHRKAKTLKTQRRMEGDAS